MHLEFGLVLLLDTRPKTPKVMILVKNEYYFNVAMSITTDVLAILRMIISVQFEPIEKF